MKKLLTLFVALIATSALWARFNNVITYTATSKLDEAASFSGSRGLHTNAFNVSITSHIFSNGTGTITFAGDVTSIGEYAFEGCYGLTSITIPNSVTSIGNYAFDYCIDLTSITIPNSVISIGGAAFSNCSGLTSITIPNSVTSIGEGAFYYCPCLTSITIPNSVTSIGEEAFAECAKLQNITCYASEPPIVKQNTFSNYYINLNVPCDFLDEYKFHAVWGSFKYIQCIEEGNSEGFESTTIDIHTQKLLHNGQVLILRDGNAYNVQGVRVEE